MIPSAPKPRTRRLSLRWRAVLAFALTSLVLSSGLALVAYALVRTSLVDGRESSAMRQAYTNARLVRNRLRDAEPDVTSLLASLQVGPSGNALLQRDRDWFSSSVSVDQSTLPTSLQQVVEDGDAARQMTTSDEGPLLTVGVPIREASAYYYEVTSLAEIDATLDDLRSSLFTATAIATLVGAAVGASITGTVFRPLRRTASVAREISAGDVAQRLAVTGDRDLDPLAQSFNDMVDELGERIRRESRFASDVSHELRGPLTTLAAAVSVVHRRRDQLPEGALDAVVALEDQVKSFNQLVLDLLEISRFEAGTAELARRDVELDAFVRAVVAERPGDRPPIRSGLGDHALVSVDPRRLQQVLGNIFDNADRYAGGVVAVSLSRSRDGEVRIVVDDAGPGIAPEDRERVFNRFERGAAAQKRGAPSGTGLGLALSAQHVALHGGRISIDDAPTGGARFIITLPRDAS